MVRKQDVVSTRENMRGGSGAVTIESWLEEGEFCPNVRVLGTMRIPVGGSIGNHVHDGEAEIFRVVSGEACYNDNGKSVEAAAGDVMVCYSGQEHGIENVGDVELVVIGLVVTGTEEI